MRKYVLPAAALIALVLLFLAGAYELFLVPGGPAFSETENRMLAELPAFTLSGFFDRSFSDGTESFLSDRFPMRAGIIRTTQSLRQIGNLASFDDYMRVAENNVADMQYQEEQSELEQIVTPRPARTAEPTPEPTVVPTESAAAVSGTPETAETPEPTATPEPTPTPRPTKAPVNAADFPSQMRCRMLSGEGSRTVYEGEKSRLSKIAALLDAYASLLPEDGVVTFTIIPYSSRANRLLTYRDPQGFSSEIEPFIQAVTANNVSAFCTVELLSEPLLKGEYVFFRSDMHWTPYGAYLVISRLMKEAGETLPPYDAFPKAQEYPFLGTIYRGNPTKQMKDNPDTLDIVTPIHPYRVLRYETSEQYREIPLIVPEASESDRYTVYLGGPGNLTVIERTDGGSGENKACFVLADSYGLCTVPFFAEAYDRVVLYDPRFYTKKQLGPVSDAIERFGVTDIYVMVGDTHTFFDDTFFASCNSQF